MKSICESKSGKGLVGFLALTLIFCIITGCGGPAAVIIVAPAAISGTALLLWYFVIAGVLSTCEPRRTITPEQVQQQQIAMQQHEAEQRRREEMDLPAGLTPSSNNFVRTGANIALTTIVVESRNLSPDHNFQVYSKGTSVNSQWQREELLSVQVQNPDNLENAGLVNRRLLFNVKENVWTSNVVVTWDN